MFPEREERGGKFVAFVFSLFMPPIIAASILIALISRSHSVVELRASTDWRCIESTEAAWGPEAKRATLLETFPGSEAHGDVCRDIATHGFFCPVGCVRVTGPPFCAARGQNPTVPCRLSQGESEHPRCLGSTDDAASTKMKQSGLLERHNPESSHGDVCRSASSSDFFCPLGCNHATAVPYCSEPGPDGHVELPCRVLSHAVLNGHDELNDAASPLAAMPHHWEVKDEVQDLHMTGDSSPQDSGDASKMPEKIDGQPSQAATQALAQALGSFRMEGSPGGAATGNVPTSNSHPLSESWLGLVGPVIVLSIYAAYLRYGGGRYIEDFFTAASSDGTA